MRTEIKLALQQGKRVIPVLFGDTQLPRAEELPEDIRALATRHSVRLTHERFRNETESLVTELQEALVEAKRLHKAQAEKERQERKNEARGRREALRESTTGKRAELAGLSLRVLVIGAAFAFLVVAGAISFFKYSSPPPATSQLTIIAPHELAFAGEAGGPFSPAELSLVLKAVGKGFHWSIASVPPKWLSVTPDRGDLTADGVTELTFQLTTEAQSLSIGHYESQFLLRNDFNAAVTASNVSLLVSPKTVPRVTVTPPLSPDRERALKPGDTFKECENCPEMIVVPAGEFTMGSPEDELGRNDLSGPQHTVRFSRQFAVARFAVTFDEWEECVAHARCGGMLKDQGWGRGRRPVINVSWQNAKAYVAWLSEKTGKTYRLLSEAEREYVTRAGSTTAFWWGNSISTSQANYDGRRTYGTGVPGEFRRRTVPVDSFEPNPWGLYQVHGNVWEWTEDCRQYQVAPGVGAYQGAPTDGSAWITGTAGITTVCDFRVVRGGAWSDRPSAPLGRPLGPSLICRIRDRWL
jgi:formylglycine-generating enzyme required for sulfatase activity